MCKLLIPLAFLLAMPAVPGFAQSAPDYGNVVTACGTTNGTAYAVGTNRPVTVDTTGKACSAASATISGTVTANQGTAGSAGWPVIDFPSAASTAGVPSVQSSALETGHVIKASAGNLYSFNVSADSTLSSVAWAVLIFNSTTVPASGAVTPVKCYLAPIGTTSISGAFPMPLYLGTGISIAVSTGQTCFTKTDSAHGFISANAQ